MRDWEVDKVVGYICEDNNLELLLLKQKGRRLKIVIVKQMIAYILYKNGQTYEEIGDLFNNHHTTAMFSFKQIDKYLDTGQSVAGLDVRACIKKYQSYINETIRLHTGGVCKEVVFKIKICKYDKK